MVIGDIAGRPAGRPYRYWHIGPDIGMGWYGMVWYGEGALYSPEIHRRRSIRLKGYDYSHAGAYFVTICAYERQCLFGEIVGGEMQVNIVGSIVAEEWTRSAELRTEIETGEFVVMPNHFHGIIVVGDDGDLGSGDQPVTPTVPGPRPRSIGAMMAGFKSIVTKRVNLARNVPNLPVWQRNYYGHIIRDDADYSRIAEYIADNPRRWFEDALHPDNIKCHLP